MRENGFGGIKKMVICMRGMKDGYEDGCEEVGRVCGCKEKGGW